MSILSKHVKFGSYIGHIIDQDGLGSNGQIEDAITNMEEQELTVFPCASLKVHKDCGFHTTGPNPYNHRDNLNYT